MGVEAILSSLDERIGAEPMLVCGLGLMVGILEFGFIGLLSFQFVLIGMTFGMGATLLGIVISVSSLMFQQPPIVSEAGNEISNQDDSEGEND